jgi:hypothetical protein
LRRRPSLLLDDDQMTDGVDHPRSCGESGPLDGLADPAQAE